jgi:hypothetical protein
LTRSSSFFLTAAALLGQPLLHRVACFQTSLVPRHETPVGNTCWPCVHLLLPCVFGIWSQSTLATGPEGAPWSADMSESLHPFLAVELIHYQLVLVEVPCRAEELTPANPRLPEHVSMARTGVPGATRDRRVGGFGSKTVDSGS